MMDIGVPYELGTIDVLDAVVMDSIIIPDELKSHLVIRTTGIGGIFLEYYSNNSGGVNTLNSRVQFSIYFDTTDGFGRYVGDNIGLSVGKYKNIKMMRSIKDKKHYKIVVNRVNKWIQTNKGFLLQSIEC